VIAGLQTIALIASRKRSTASSDSKTVDVHGVVAAWTVETASRRQRDNANSI